MKVRVDLTLLVNIGNFESVRIDYGLEDEVGRKETVDEARERLEDLILTWQRARLDEVEEEYGRRRTFRKGK